MPAQKAKAAAVPAVDPLAPYADELGALEKELAPLAGKIARRESLRKQIRAQAPDTQERIFGARFIVELGPRANRTLIDFPALARKIGCENFAQFATASLETLTEHVKPGITALFLRQEQTGPRSIKVFERGQVG